MTNELTSKVQRLWPKIVAGCEADPRHDVQSYFEFDDRVFRDLSTISKFRDSLFSDREMTDELLSTVRRSKSSILRRLAADLLGHLILFYEDAELADRIIGHALEKQSPPAFPARYLSALPEKLGSQERLVPLLESKSPDTRERAARCIASVDFPKKKEIFEQVLKKGEKNHEVITTALWELMPVADEKTVPLVKPYLTANEFWQAHALTCLETALGARGCETYAALLNERKFRNKINATRALIEYCGISAMPHLSARFRNTLRAKDMSCDRDGRSERTMLLEYFWEHREHDDAQKLIDVAKKKKDGFDRREIAYLEESGSELAAYLLG